MACPRKLFCWLTSLAFALSLIAVWTEAVRVGQPGASAQQRPELPCRRADSGEDSSSEGGDSVDRVKATSSSLCWARVAVAAGVLEWDERGTADVAARTRSAEARGPPAAASDVARS